MATTPADVYRYRAAGFTDEVVTCEACGRDELKGTVRLEVVDAEGAPDGGELFAGVSCAARLQGTTAAVVRAEVRAAADAARAAWEAWRAEAHAVEMRAGDAALARLGLERSFSTLKVVWEDPVYRAEVAAWRAAHPQPPRP